MPGVRCRVGSEEGGAPQVTLRPIIDPLRISCRVTYSFMLGTMAVLETRETSTGSLELLDPLLHLFPHCLVGAHERLLVDDDFGRIGLWTTDSGGDGCGVGLDDDAISGNETMSCTRCWRTRTRRRWSRLGTVTPGRGFPARLASRPDCAAAVTRHQTAR